MKPESKLSPMAWICAAILCCTCAGNDGLSPEIPSEEGYGRVELSLTTPTASRAATDYNTDDFMVTVKRFNKPINEPVSVGDIKNKTFPVGGGYTAYVENCTAAEAEAANDGWGQIHLAGESDEFRIYSEKTTKVKVTAATRNAAVCVRFHPSWKEYFNKSTTVTITEANRPLVWTYANAGTMGNGTSTNGNMAYFNLGTDETRTVSYIIVAESKEERKEITGKISLSRADFRPLILKYEGTIKIEITTDKNFYEIDHPVIITPNNNE